MYRKAISQTLSPFILHSSNQFILNIKQVESARHCPSSGLAIHTQSCQVDHSTRKHIFREPPRALFRLLVLPDYFRVGFAYSRVYVCLSAASTAGGPGPGPYSQGRRETPEENRPAMRAIIPQPMSPPLDLYSSPSAVAAYERIPGLFALFDKYALFYYYALHAQAKLYIV